MKKTIAVMALALWPVSSGAVAQERAGDAALGALSGAVVLGPIGAVAGAVVGYTAGPSISHSWGTRRSGTARRGRKPAEQDARASMADGQPAPRNQVSPPTATPVPPAAPRAASTAPPVQGLE
ncbi:DNA-directed RNA polymerase subunit N [Bradyrhizobium canariense]|uniref:DNA-directed RNA polymerase subunit N n=1 Tax=Bradyrhizobium canariense TaxID=255045 RepID=A0A1H1R9G4_9BRAD|nr:DNA-directed RNA polymerase subunit N [Bradyrhizobium canariense]SDS32305.1 hypothetical protein SAMN05444158_1700 [Bradyrhizobium canariense]